MAKPFNVALDNYTAPYRTAGNDPNMSYASSSPGFDFGAGERKTELEMLTFLAGLNEQKAGRVAQEAYNKKRLELESKGLGLQADQLAKQYALQMAQLEWEKESFKLQFGETQAQNQFEREFQTRQQQLDEGWRTAEQMGFRDGVPTLANLQFQEQQRQFNANLGFQNQQFGENQRQFNESLTEQQRQFNATQNNQAQQLGLQGRELDANNYFRNRDADLRQQEIANQYQQWDRDFNFKNITDQRNFTEDQRRYNQDFGEGQRQFNVSSVLNAPRGPADWAAYTARLRGLQQSGGLPGAVGTMFDPSAQVASYSNYGQQTGPVLSNTQLALAMTGQGGAQNLQGTPWQGMAGPQSQGQPAQTNSSNPYSETGAPSGSSDAAARMLGGGGNQQSSANMALPSAQKFRKYSPTEQQMGLGYLEENGGPTAQDAQYLMERQSPNYARARKAQYAGM
jgi:hypothetical protein